MKRIRIFTIILLLSCPAAFGMKKRIKKGLFWNTQTSVDQSFMIEKDDFSLNGSSDDSDTERKRALHTTPENITPKNYRDLNLTGQSITLVPTQVFDYTNLRKLDLSHNKLIAITSEIGNLKNLEELSLNNNGLSELPESLCTLSKLRALNVSTNHLGAKPNKKALPNDFAKLASLTYLALNNNDLREFPEQIMQLYNLTSLYLKNNYISTISDRINLLQKLESLDMSDNQVTDLTPAIGDLKVLKNLVISRNKLELLPLAIGNCQNLVRLECANRENFPGLRDLPQTLIELIHLEHLDLANNYHVKQLPVGLQSMLNGKTLYLHGSGVDPNRPQDTVIELANTQNVRNEQDEVELFWQEVSEDLAVFADHAWYVLDHVVRVVGNYTTLTALALAHLCGKVE